MSRRKKKDRKRDRLQLATAKRERLDKRRTSRQNKREERRTAGMSWLQRSGLDDLFEGSPAHRGQAWCIIGFLLGIAMIAVYTLLGSVLIAVLGSRLSQFFWHSAWCIFLPSFFGVFVFRYFEYVLEGEAFGRGKALDAPLETATSSYQTKEVKIHTDDLLAIGPTLRDRVFPLAFLGLPMLWYGLLAAFWFVVPNAYDFSEDATLTEMGLPFALPLPFVIAGVALLALPRTLRFDRKTKRLRITNLWQKQILMLSDIKSLQLIPGRSIQLGNRKHGRSRPTVSTVQLNLVMGDPEFPRINISHDISRKSAIRIGRLLSQFLDVPIDNAFADPDTA